MYRWLVLLFFCSCTINTTTLNDKDSIEATEKVVKDFYQQLKTRDYRNTTVFLADTLLKTTDTSTIFKYFEKKRVEDGDIVDVSLLKCETKNVNSDKKTVIAVAVYDVKRTKTNTKEFFVLKSINDDQLKIQRYDIKEDLK
jgi:hypothetical protein